MNKSIYTMFFTILCLYYTILRRDYSKLIGLQEDGIPAFAGNAAV